jgi:hypothetical protein
MWYTSSLLAATASVGELAVPTHSRYLTEFWDYKFEDVLSLERNYQYGGQSTSRISCGLI